MSTAWRDRAYTTEEAAAIAGVCRATLDVWLYRFAGHDLSERREGRRWWSHRDIAVIRTALRLNARLPLAQAIPTSIQHLLHCPPPDLFLVSDSGRSFTTCADTACAYAIERGATVVAIGALSADVEDACALLVEHAPDSQLSQRIPA